MTNLLKVTNIKLRSTVLFYLMFLFYGSIGSSLGLLKLVPQGLTGREAFLETIGDTSFFFTIALFISYFLSRDFIDRTLFNEVRLGCKRSHSLLARASVVLPIGGIFHLIYVGSTTLSVTIHNGFGQANDWQQLIFQALLVFFQVMAIQSIVILLVFLFQHSLMGIVSSLIVTFVTCNLLRNLIDSENPWFNLTSFMRIMMNYQRFSVVDISVSYLSAIGTMACVLVVTVLLFKKSELK